MSKAELQAVGWSFETRSEILEGDEYQIADVRVGESTILKCTLFDQRIAEIQTSSPNVRDQYGLGAGTSLMALKVAYPKGRFSAGHAEGPYASFITGTRLIFRFNPSDLPDACLEYGSNCTFDEEIRAKSISLGAFAPK